MNWKKEIKVSRIDILKWIVMDEKMTQEFTNHFKMSPTFLLEILLEEHFPKNSWDKVQKEKRYQKIKQLRKVGFTYREIGEILGISRQRVHSIVMERTRKNGKV